MKKLGFAVLTVLSLIVSVASGLMGIIIIPALGLNLLTVAGVVAFFSVAKLFIDIAVLSIEDYQEERKDEIAAALAR